MTRSLFFLANCYVDTANGTMDAAGLNLLPVSDGYDQDVFHILDVVDGFTHRITIRFIRI